MQNIRTQGAIFIPAEVCTNFELSIHDLVDHYTPSIHVNTILLLRAQVSYSRHDRATTSAVTKYVLMKTVKQE